MIAKSEEQGRFADSLVADDDHLESVVVLLNHVYIYVYKLITKIICKYCLAGIAREYSVLPPSRRAAPS